MVTKNYLESLREARFFEPYDRAAAEATMLSHLQAGLPGWDAHPDGILRRALPLLAEVLFTQGEILHSQLRRGLLLYAQGTDLDRIGLGPPAVVRMTGEADDDYRLRIANSGELLNIGTLASVERLVTDADPTITDVQAWTLTNRQDVNVAAVRGGDLTTMLASSDPAYADLSDRDKIIAGVEATGVAHTVQAFTADLTVVHDPHESDAVALEAVVRTAVYNFLNANRRLGRPVYRSAIAKSAFVAAVLDVTVNQPAANLAAANGRVYNCPSDDASVTISVQEV